jgi:hypothetical protein
METHPMKLVTLALIAAFAITATAQNNRQAVPSETPDLTQAPPPSNQQGCPVAFTEVSLQRKARFMPVKQDAAPDNSLAFKYKNQSGKQIESIEIRVELTVKQSIYDLDTTTITRYMTLTGTSEDVLPLKSLLMYGIGSVTLEQVTYVGGGIWTPGVTKNCSYTNPNTSEKIGTLK